jgi:arabinan endo-1,5-alpha-L-arabinosidase
MVTAIALGLGSAASLAGPADTGPFNDALSGDIAPVHDPAIIKAGGTYYLFTTGRPGRDKGGYIGLRTSRDLKAWTPVAAAVPDIPHWAYAAVPGVRDMWAPDIAYVNGRYRLYYALSTFGSNRSAIGLFTSPTLDPAAPDYRWRDEGLVVQSTEASDFNAIDANFIAAADGRHWLALGSFWSGIKLFELDPATGKPKNVDARPIAIARRPVPAGGPAPVEAPFIITHGDFYYLFVSYDYCCKGANSTYYTVVGRSAAIDGPYLGRDGSSLMNGEGTIVLRADLREQQRFRGPGHVAILHDGTRDLIVYHAYDKAANGLPTLRISPLTWDADGWPKVG